MIMHPLLDNGLAKYMHWVVLMEAVAITVTLESDIGKTSFHPSHLHTPARNFYIDGIFSSGVIGENISIAGIPLIPML